MKVFVIGAMEGVAGIVKRAQTSGGEALYEEGRRLSTEESNAAVRGARAAGATEIVVMDCHRLEPPIEIAVDFAASDGAGAARRAEATRRAGGAPARPRAARRRRRGTPG